MASVVLELNHSDGTQVLVFPGGSRVPLQRGPVGFTEESVNRARVIISGIMGKPVGFVVAGRRTTSTVVFDVREKSDCCG